MLIFHLFSFQFFQLVDYAYYCAHLYSPFSYMDDSNKLPARVMKLRHHVIKRAELYRRPYRIKPRNQEQLRHADQIQMGLFISEGRIWAG